MKKEKILIVDDSEMNRSLLADMLCDGYDVVEAEDGLQAITMMKKTHAQLSLVLLDIVMPHLDGFGVLEAMKKNRWIEDLPVIIISAENASPQVERAYALGAADFIARPFDTLVVRRRVINTLMLYAKRKQLFGMVEEQIYEKEKNNDLVIDILSHIVEFRNGESGPHIIHVRKLTDLLLGYVLEKSDKYNLTSDDIPIISTASALHDIGKIAISENILNKPGRLTPEEFAEMKKHSAIGAEMLSGLPGYKEEKLVRVACEICRWHHERWDGRGYPDGLRGDDIPISAQIVALADVYDALTSTRVYKPALTHEKAVEMIVGGECGSFNPLLLECLREHSAQIRAALRSGSIADARSRKLRSVTTETVKRVGGSASERTLRLLDKERVRNSFYAAMTEAIRFEYTAFPPMITLSEWGAKKLGLNETIVNPARDEALTRVLGKGGWEDLEEHFRSTTPENPRVRVECVLHYNGASRWHRVVAQTLWSTDDVPRCEGVLGIVMDIHDAHLKMEELTQKATRDSLTGLLNRGSAREQIELRMKEEPHGRFALAEIDIDDFKRVNDQLGHMFGDQVLRELARRMSHSVRSSDICCRAGGEEFFLFLDYRGRIESTIDRIYKNLCFEIEGRSITVSMGVALSAAEGAMYDRLYRAADAALYAAKQGGKHRYRFYDKNTMPEAWTPPRWC